MKPLYVVTFRISPDEMCRVAAAIAARIKVPTCVPMNFSEWVRAAVSEKLAKGNRSRRSRHKPKRHPDPKCRRVPEAA